MFSTRYWYLALNVRKIYHLLAAGQSCECQKPAFIASVQKAFALQAKILDLSEH